MTPTITRILVPTDFGPASDAALNYAIAIAQRFGASLQLLHVVDDPLAGGPAWGPETFIASVPALQATLLDEAAARLSVLLARAEADWIPARHEVRLGRPADVIREVAERGDADLIVMGTHGRTGITHLLMGSAAERTLRTAPCPVLTVHAADPLAVARDRLERALAPTK